MPIIRTGSTTLVELIDLVNSIMIFLSQMTLLGWLTFPLGSLTVTHSPALLDLFLFFDASICSTMAFPTLGNSDHVVVSVSIDFLINSKQDALFHCIAYDYSCANWDHLCDHLGDIHETVSLNSVLLLLLVNFVSGYRLELIQKSLIVDIRSNLTHLHGFLQLVLLS